MDSSPEPAKVELTRTEMQRLEWLTHVSLGIEDAEKKFNALEADIWRESLARVQRTVDWNAIARFVFPHIVCVVVRDVNAQQRAAELAFFDHVRYVVFPRTGYALDLYSEYVVIEVDEDRAGRRPVLSELVAQLSNQINEIDESRRGEAMKHLRAVQRILGLRQ